jgi:hypothetical protein
MADAARRFVATVKDDAAMPSDREISRRGSVPNAPRRASVGVMQTPKNRRFSLLGRHRTIAAPSINELHIISSDGPQPLLAVPVGSTSALWAVPKGTDPGQLMQPRTVLAHKGALVVTDLRNGRVEAFHPRTGAHIRTIRRIPAPVGLTVLDDYLYVTSWSDHKVHKIRLVHLVPGVAAQEVAAWGGHGIASRQFKCPTGIATVNGELCIVDRRNHRLTFLTTEGEFVRSIGSKGSQPGQFLDPFGVKEHLGVLYVVDAGNSRVQVLTPQGALLDVLTVQDASANLRDLDVSADGKKRRRKKEKEKRAGKLSADGGGMEGGAGGGAGAGGGGAVGREGGGGGDGGGSGGGGDALQLSRQVRELQQELRRRDELLKLSRRRERREGKTTFARGRQAQKRSSKEAKRANRKKGRKEVREQAHAARREAQRERKRRGAPQGEALHTAERKRQRLADAGTQAAAAAAGRAR